MYLFFDVETTGLPLNWQAPVSSYNMWPRIVQIAFIRCGKNGKILESYNYLVRPDNYTIPDEAIAIHGLRMNAPYLKA
jgi:DNA polymerase III subunit epsilon